MGEGSYCYSQVTSFFKTQILPMFPFYTPWKQQKSKVFLVFSGDIKLEHWNSSQKWIKELNLMFLSNRKQIENNQLILLL